MQEILEWIDKIEELYKSLISPKGHDDSCPYIPYPKYGTKKHYDARAQGTLKRAHTEQFGKLKSDEITMIISHQCLFCFF